MVKNPKGTQHRGPHRNYKQEYEAFGGTPKEIKAQTERVTARRSEVKKAGGKIPKMTEVDHIKPISKGGTNDPSNLRLVPRKVNRHKGNRAA